MPRQNREIFPFQTEVTEKAQPDLLDYIWAVRESGERADWFPYIFDQMDRYVAWTTVKIDGAIRGFSAIQQHNFPVGVVRVLTRTYFDKAVRSPSQIDFEFIRNSPSSHMVHAQVEWLKKRGDFKACFVSMEPHRSQRNFARLISYFNREHNYEFEVLNKRYKTYPNQKPEDHQHIAVLSFTPLLKPSDALEI